MNNVLCWAPFPTSSHLPQLVLLFYVSYSSCLAVNHLSLCIAFSVQDESRNWWINKNCIAKTGANGKVRHTEVVMAMWTISLYGAYEACSQHSSVFCHITERQCSFCIYIKFKSELLWDDTLIREIQGVPSQWKLSDCACTQYLHW